MSPSRKVRGLTLVGSLLATLVIAGLAALAILLWWAPLIGIAAVAASFLWLRSGVQGEIAARRATRGGGASARPARRPADRRSAPGAGVDRSHVPTAEHEVSAAPEGASEPELIETATVSAADDARPDGWQPVPVPPPTYTLKAKAERPTSANPPMTPDLPAEADDGAQAEASVPSGTESAPVATPAAVGEADAERTAAYGT